MTIDIPETRQINTQKLLQDLHWGGKNGDALAKLRERHRLAYATLTAIEYGYVRPDGLTLEGARAIAALADELKALT